MITLSAESKRIGVTQADLSRRTGLHTSTLSSIFNGRMKPWPGQREKLIRALREVGWDGDESLLFEEVTL